MTREFIMIVGLGGALLMVAMATGDVQSMTQGEYICLGVLILIDALGVAGAYLLKRKYEDSGDVAKGGSAPFAPTLTLALIVMTCHAAVSIYWKRLVYQPGPSIDALEAGIQGNIRILGFSVGAALLPFSMYTSILIRTFSHGAADLIDGFQTAKPPETDFSKARALYVKGDTEGALRMCKEYFAENPETPRALFEASRILMKEERREEAADFLRQILRHFEKNDGVWVKATYDLAGIYENHLDDRKTADYMLGEIVKRSPETETGRLARGRLGRAWDKADKFRSQQERS